VFLSQRARRGGRLLGQDLEVKSSLRRLLILGVLKDGRGLAGQVDVEHLVRHTDQMRATRVAHGTRLLSKLFLIMLSRGVLSSMSRLNEVIGQALDQVLLPRQALGGLRRLIGGLVKDPTGREILRTREIGFHIIMMVGGYAVKLVWECDLRGLDA